MRSETPGAILYTFFGVTKITAAAVAQSVQRAKAEQATEFFRICIFVAGKIFAVSVLEKIMTSHRSLLFNMEIM